jgi:hypothetical protein
MQSFGKKVSELKEIIDFSDEKFKNEPEYYENGYRTSLEGPQIEFRLDLNHKK